jgi:predicted GNAT superfamily acetyltransferase
MQLNTSASVISFAKQLEANSTAFYQKMAERYPKGAELFLSFAKENSKYATMIERAYYGVITDAIEGCFAFSVETDRYMIEKELAKELGYVDALNQAVNMEQKLISFYTDAAEQSKAFMADVPRTFLIVAKKRKDREDKLRALLKEK